MRIFLINLARRPDRLAAMTGALARLALDVTRIEALDAATAPNLASQLGAVAASSASMRVTSSASRAKAPVIAASRSGRRARLMRKIRIVARYAGGRGKGQF